VVDTLLTLSDVEPCCLIIDLLNKIASPWAEEAFAECLRQQNHHPAVYYNLGVLLKNTARELMRLTGKPVLAENSWWPKTKGERFPSSKES